MRGILLSALTLLTFAQLSLGQDPEPAKQIHTVNIAVTKDVAPSSKIQLNINTQNLAYIHLTATPIEPIRWLTYDSARNICPPAGRGPMEAWTLRIAAKNQEPNPDQADTYYSRQINLPRMHPGVYLLQSVEGDKRAWAVVNVTDLAVVVKRSPKHALLWVTDFKTGKVVPDAKVSYYNSEGQSLQTGETSEDGAKVMAMKPGSGTFVIRRGHDIAGIPTSQGDPDGRLVAHFQTDRPIYRPGQKVAFKALLRRTLGQGYAVAAHKSCLVQIRDPKDNPLDELHIDSTGMGSVSGEFSIPSEAMTGPYSLVLKTGTDTAYQTITVAEYRKPEFKVDVRPQAKRYLAGEDISFTVNASYFFGAPVPQAQVHYVARRNGIWFGGFDSVTSAFYSGDGNLYSSDTYQSNPFVAEDNAYTDAKGNLVITLKTDKDAPDADYTIECTVIDSSRRQVSGGSSVPVYSADLRIGLSTNLSYATLGSLIPVQVRAIDLDGHPTRANVDIRITKPYYDVKSGERKELLITSTSVKVPASGVYTISLPAKSEGELRIYAKAKDDTGRYAKAGLSVYVEGNYEEAPVEREQPAVGVRLDKREYSPGDVANAFVTTNNPHHPILQVLEGGDVWDYRVVIDPARGQIWPIHADLRLSPNAYVAAEQWVKGSLVSGNVMMPVPDRSKAIKVTITSDKQVYEPGDKATYKVHTADGHGSPVQSEVAFSVVDEAIFAMAPDVTDDLYKLYWGLRPDGVSMEASAPEELSGGAYQRVSAVAPVRQRFEDTADWSPTVLTDSQGNASISFEMPGNLTAWRATGRAVTLATGVGTGMETVTATRPVTLRLATPRQMVVGDRITLIGTIDNRSSQPHKFEVRLDGAGIQVSGGNTQQIAIKAKSEGKVEWVLDAKSIPPDGQASISGQVEATDAPGADNADALRVKVPVVPNGLPNHFVKSGALTHDTKTLLDLPLDRIEPATVAKIMVWAGIRPAMENLANQVLGSPRYGSVGATDQLQVARVLGLSYRDDHVRESLALLSRTQRNDGWGWWENAPTDPYITARTLSVLAEAKGAGMTVFKNLFDPAKEAAVARYNGTNLWEQRAILATASVLAGDERGATEVDEVMERGQSLSPYAKFRLARALFTLGKNARAEKELGEAMENASEGDSQTYVPGGDGIGWSASDVETTAQALEVLAIMSSRVETQSKFARWLVSSNEVWMSLEERSDVVAALNAYLRRHRETVKIGAVAATCNGHVITLVPDLTRSSVSGIIARSSLRDGGNDIQIHKDSEGEALFSVDARVYQPVYNESTRGIQVLRRFEVKNAGGIWVELDRAVHPGEPVRCTTIAWGDDLRDAVKVTDPLPAGFEYIEDSMGAGGYQEVRDGAVEYYLVNSGTPETFRFFLRAETEGSLLSLPASAEYLRRPKAKGNTVPMHIEVREVKK